jgi:hypothetical protein
MGSKKKVDAPATDVVAAVEKILEPKPVELFSSEKGSIACKDHTPIKGSDTWRFDRWRKMTSEDIEAFERELGHPIACETCAAVKRNAAPESTPPTEEEPAPQKKGKKTKTDATLADLAERYLAHMEKEGKSNGTCFSYKLELMTALNELGADTKLADLTPEKVALYFGSERVNKKRNGKGKSPLSIAKTQRVLRLALVWAEGAKLIAKAPLPENLATH